MCEQFPLVCVWTYAEKSWFSMFLPITVIMRLGYLVDVNVLAFNSPGPVPEGVMWMPPDGTVRALFVNAHVWYTSLYTQFKPPAGLIRVNRALWTKVLGSGFSPGGDTSAVNI